ncbi:MAG: hypothetical protein AAGI17_00220 [Planctomycetota bacterium]
MSKLTLAGVIALAGPVASPFVGTAAGQVTFTEADLGEFSDDANAPTVLDFIVGINTVSGSVTQSNDLANGNRDFFTFTLTAGQELVAVNVIQWEDLASGSGNQGFIGGNIDSVGLVPGGATSADFEFGTLVGGTDVGNDILPDLAANNTAGPDFIGPVGPGTYTFVIQQTGPQNSSYTLDFVVTPAPATAAMLGFAGLTAARRRR